MKLSAEETDSLAASIRETDALDVLRRLIKFDTSNPPGNESECGGYVADYLRDAGAAVAGAVGDPAAGPGLVTGARGP